MVDCAWVAGEDAVRVGAFDEFEESLFAGFLDARGGEEETEIGFRAGPCDGVGVAADVFEVEVGGGDAGVGGGDELGAVAAEDAEIGCQGRVGGAGGGDGEEEIGEGRSRGGGGGGDWVRRGGGFEGGDEGAAETIEFADGEHDVVREVGDEVG